jgi:SEC-C motif
MTKISKGASSPASSRRATRKPAAGRRRIIPAPARLTPIVFDGPVRGVVVADPRSEPVLADFKSDGLAETPGEHAAAIDVMNIARSAYMGAFPRQRLGVLKSPADEPVGFILVRMMGAGDDYTHLRGPSVVNAPYISALGRLDAFTNHRLADGLPVGAALLRLGHDMIELEADGRPFPPVCARHFPDNRRSARAFDGAGYLNFPKEWTGRQSQDIRWRPASPPAPPLDRSAYIPPEALPEGPRPITIARPMLRYISGGRGNSRCPCGSGRKFKKCCGR